MKNILLTGSSGKLGSTIQKLNVFKNVLTPDPKELDITSEHSVRNFFENNSFDIVIHCAAQARVGIGQKDPVATIQTNIIGTAHLVSAVLRYKSCARFVHISTDGVYQSTVGNYSEDSPTIPYNNYCWTKLGAECSVNLLSNYCIVRTSFFDSEAIPFDDAAIDSFSSKLEIKELVKALKVIAESDFVGTINIGDEKKSDYDRYKEYKPSIKSTTYQDIQEGLPFKLYQDASMDITKWKKLKESNEKPKYAAAEKAKVVDSSSCL